MSLYDSGINHKTIGGYLFASIRSNLQSRKEMHAVIAELRQTIPADFILGPAMFINHFINSMSSGYDAEVGFPVSDPVMTGRITTRRLPELDVLAKVHTGGTATLGESYAKVYATQNEYGLISDEFCIEVFLDHDDPEGQQIEVNFIHHQWETLFKQNLERVMGDQAAHSVLRAEEMLALETPADERFAWAKALVERLDNAADERQRYEVLSSCSHIFPREQANKLHEVYQQAYDQDGNMLKAVDAVIAFMAEDPCWRNIACRREGRVIFTHKNPRDPAGFEKAQTDLERKRAYCFCPIIRNHLEDGMSPTFCYCSAGWERKQWEVAVGRLEKIDVVRSILKGDDVCEFAIHLPQEG